MLSPITLVVFGVLMAEPSSAANSNTSDVDAAAQRAFELLPDNMGFVFTELTNEGPKPLFGRHENEQFAIGSSFKLFILGTLAREVNADRRQLANVMTLPDTGSRRSLLDFTGKYVGAGRKRNGRFLATSPGRRDFGAFRACGATQ